MHQSIETPTLWVPGKGRGFDIDPGQKASISLPPEARVQIKRPYPWGNKDENNKVSHFPSHLLKRAENLWVVQKKQKQSRNANRQSSKTVVLCCCYSNVLIKWKQTNLANIRGWLYRLLNMNLDFILVLNVLDGNIDKSPPPPNLSRIFGKLGMLHYPG